MGKLSNWLLGLQRKSGVVGLEYSAHGFCVALRDIQGAGVSLLHVHERQNDGPSLANELVNFAKGRQLARRTCNVVLPNSEYQLLLVETPDVPDEEMREAVRWRIRDLISMPVESVAVDVFRLPADANRSGKKMLYAVVAELQKVHAIIDVVKECGMDLNCIEIEELALGKLLESQASERAVALVRIRENAGWVAIYRAGHLYLSRQFRLNYAGGLLEDLPAEAIALEVQRSLDYFERQMGQAPPATLFVCGVGIGSEKLTPEFKSNFSVPVQFLDFSSFGVVSADTDEGISQMSAGAIAVCYREDAA